MEKFSDDKGGWVKAKGTTLGADNGLGVAAIMAVLEAKDLKHGPLEALVTKDEETGMYGAFGLKPGTVYISFNRIFFKIVYSIVVLLRNHIHVRLKNHTFPVFHTRSGGFTDNHITCFVYKRLQPQLFSET